MKKFMKIDNGFFDTDKKTGLTVFYSIGTEGFTIYCYLLMMAGSCDLAQVNIKMIREFLNRNINKRTKCKDGLKDRRTILKYLLALKRENFIECDELNENTMLNDILIIKVNNKCDSEQGGNGWSGISTELFTDYIHKLGHIGWSTYCLLFKNHNITFGNDMKGNVGFAYPSEKYMGDVSNRHQNTIKQYIPLLKELRLIKVISQDPVTYVQPSGVVETKYMANHYIVNAKAYYDNKYHIKF